MRNVVLDTNVLVSGIIASGYSATILDAARRGKIQLVTSPYLIDEFSEVMARRHIARKYPNAAEEAESMVDFIRAFARLTAGIPEDQGVSPDRDDDSTCWLAQRRKTQTASYPVILICSV